MEWLINWDYALFYLINGEWTNAYFDFWLPQFRDKHFWIPLYLILLFLLIKRFRTNAIPVIVFALITVALTDQISSSVIKPLIERLRPCNDESIRESVRLLINCGPGFSFTSSHAANHFGIGLFLGKIFAVNKKWLLPFFLIWAFSVSYAQIYVGVHYPLDILGGAALGAGIGAFNYFLLKTFYGNPYEMDGY